MKKAVLNSFVLVLAIGALQGCKGGDSQSTPANQYYAPQVAGSPSQGKPLSFLQTNPNMVPIVECRLEDKDSDDRRRCDEKRHHHRDGDDPDKGIVICYVPPSGPPQTLCLSFEGVLAHFNDPNDYLGVCNPTPMPTPTPRPFGG